MFTYITIQVPNSRAVISTQTVIYVTFSEVLFAMLFFVDQILQGFRCYIG